MNDFSEIEAELRKLRPARVDAGLTARIEAALAQPAPGTPTSRVVQRRRSMRRNWLPLGLGVGLAAAATLLMLARVDNDHQRNSPQKTIATVAPAPVEPASRSGPRFLPAGLTEVVYQTRDEGLQFPEGAEQPMRRMRYATQETLRWHNSETGASLRVSYPSEEVMLIPVAGQ